MGDVVNFPSSNNKEANPSFRRGPLLVNIFGGPGCGKSTMAAGLKYRLGLQGINAEIAHEWVKEVIYAGDNPRTYPPSEILHQSTRRIERLTDKVDVIICDSPILMIAIYNKDVQAIAIEATHTHNLQQWWEPKPVNILLTRHEGAFDQRGRVHSYEESLKVDEECMNALCGTETEFTITMSLNTIEHEVMKRLNNG